MVWSGINIVWYANVTNEKRNGENVWEPDINVSSVSWIFADASYFRSLAAIQICRHPIRTHSVLSRLCWYMVKAGRGHLVSVS
jgi:hypothetical protein